MKKFLLFVGIGVAVILIMVLAEFLMTMSTKSASPEDEVAFHKGNLHIKVFYNRPYKKGRDIFGGLVPFNEVWRTGANEATTFEVNQNIKVGDQNLRAGKYTLWTIPHEDSWTIIFNSEFGQWGINSKGEANRNPDKDVLSLEVKSLHQDVVFEQFTIAFETIGEEVEMVLYWDKTMIAIPISVNI